MSIKSPIKTILVLAANPKDTSRLRLDEEIREIKAGLQRSRNRDQFRLVSEWAVRPRDIQRAMLDNEPNIVHFSGHGSGNDGLVFEDDTGSSKLVEGQALAQLIDLFSDTVECVVLNGCYSAIQAQAIAQHIENVIGMTQVIGDRAAIEFSVGFYDALGAGRPVEFAYKLGCNSIAGVEIPENLTPILIQTDHAKRRHNKENGTPLEVLHPRNQKEESDENPNPDDVQLMTNLERNQRISIKKLKGKAWKGYLIAMLMILYYLGLTILTMFHMAFFPWYLLLLIIGITVLSYLLKPYSKEMKLYYNYNKNSRCMNAQQSVYIGRGKFMKKESLDSYLIYELTASCIYSYCNEGKIVVRDAPPREITGTDQSCVGICSIEGKNHSYKINNILVATKKPLDWRPLEKT
jgi:CHAT domain